MRIIAGRLGGRIFDTPKTFNTHPMAERVRGGLFNALGDISGLTVLDAFAGSGALSFEAVSRGAVHAVALDNDKDAFRTIVRNIEQLELQDSIEPYLKQASSWLSSHQAATFDIVLADPPYTDLRRDLLFRVAQRTKPAGIFVVSWPGSEAPPPFTGFKIARHKSYGDAQLLFYVRGVTGGVGGAGETGAAGKGAD